MNFLYTKNDNKNTIIKYFLSLIPLILYGIYKNGFLLYQKGFISFISMFKPLILIFLSIIINAIVNLIFKQKIKLDFSYLTVCITVLFLMPSINVWLYLVVLFLGLILTNLLNRFITFNNVAFLHLLIVLVVFITGKYNYHNVGENFNIYSFSLFDTIFGRNVSGLATSNIALGIIIYFYLSIKTNYKKNIPIISYSIYLVTTFFIMLATHDLNYNNLFSSIIPMAFILVATESFSSPYSMIGESLYSIIIGFNTAIISIWLPFEGVFIIILLFSFFTNIFDKLARLINSKKIKIHDLKKTSNVHR